MTKGDKMSEERMWQLAHTCVKAATEKKPDVTFEELATAALLDFIPKGENELRDAMWSAAELAGAREEETKEIACFLEEITKDCALYWAGKQGFLKQRVTQIWEFPECYDENTCYR